MSQGLVIIEQPTTGFRNSHTTKTTGHSTYSNNRSYGFFREHIGNSGKKVGAPGLVCRSTNTNK
jgi:hypothetical protein